MAFDGKDSVRTTNTSDGVHKTLLTITNPRYHPAWPVLGLPERGRPPASKRLQRRRL